MPRREVFWNLLICDEYPISAYRIMNYVLTCFCFSHPFKWHSDTRKRKLLPPFPRNGDSMFLLHCISYNVSPFTMESTIPPAIIYWLTITLIGPRHPTSSRKTQFHRPLLSTEIWTPHLYLRVSTQFCPGMEEIPEAGPFWPQSTVTWGVDAWAGAKGRRGS